MGLLAVAALMVNHLLNVAVGISAGVGALTSAVPAIHPYTVWLCLGILVAITIMNLRWWGYLMHTARERRLRARLLRYGGHNLVIATVPWQLEVSVAAEAIAAEEPAQHAQAPQRHT